MSAAERRAVLQEGLDQAYWYRAWAALKHGLPSNPGRNVIGDEPQPEIIPIPYLDKQTVSELSSKISTATPPVVPQGPSIGSRIVAGVVGASLLAGGAGAGGLAAWLASRETPAPPAVVSPVEAGPVYGDLLQWLDQEGYNLPPSAGGTP